MKLLHSVYSKFVILALKLLKLLNVMLLEAVTYEPPPLPSFMN